MADGRSGDHRHTTTAAAEAHARGLGQRLHGDEGGDAIAVFRGEVCRLEEDEADGAVARLGL